MAAVATERIVPPETGWPRTGHLVDAIELRDHTWMVLIRMAADFYTPFVTWRAAPNPHTGNPNGWECCWGHYHSSLDRAVADFADRALHAGTAPREG